MTKTNPLQIQEGGNHYKELKIQPVEYCHANGIPFIEGSVIKYVSRWRAKGGVADLKKARHFIDLLIELEGREHEKNSPKTVPRSPDPDIVGVCYGTNA